MYIQESNLIYANEDSTSYGVMLCTIGNINTDSGDEKSNLILTTTPYKDTWNFHGKEKSEPLTFPLTIAKRNGEYFDAHELRAIKKWLCKGTWNWLQIDQSDISSAFYYCIITNPRPVNVANMNAGLEFTVTCNAPYAWSELKGRSKIYESSSTKQYLLPIDSDFEDYIIKPILTITSRGSGVIKIHNNTTNQIVQFNNCSLNETIALDCRNYKIKSSTGRIMLDNWNKNILSFIDGLNTFTLTGNFTMKIEYRLPIRIGG